MAEMNAMANDLLAADELHRGRFDSEGIRDLDRDSLHILPLSIIPLQSPALSRARLIKNVRLESMIELFDDAKTGSGQLDIEALPQEFGWPKVPLHPDLVILRKLATMPSFDVYSLRVLLRKLGIPVNDYDALRLSKTKNRELTDYMAHFTRPLIEQIYGAEDMSIQRFEDLIGLFRDPDVKKALQKLKIMAARLEIRVDEVPRFLEDYGDIFLSLSYFRQCLDHIEPIVSDVLDSLQDMRNHFQLKQDANLMKTCRMMEETLNSVMANVTGRFETFDRSTKDLWSRVSADRFHRVQKLIIGYHTTIGGVLCSLTVKMDAWARLFPGGGVGSPVRRAEFVLSEMRQGIHKIQHIESSAPMLSELC